jgi:hypothetical protein
VPWTAFAQVSSQPHLAQPNPLVPPPSVVIVRPNPAPDVAEEARQRAYNAIVGPYRDAQQLRLQQQQYELQQLEIERQKLALQAEEQAYQEQLKAQAQRDLELWKQQQQKRGLQSKTKKKH